MRVLKTVAVLALLGLTMAGKNSLKQKLAERGNTLAQVSTEGAGGCACACPDLDTSCSRPLNVGHCNCTLGNLTLELPSGGLGSSPFEQTAVKTVLSSNSEQVFESIPESSFTAYDESVCCSCENAAHQAGVNATKVRKFGIHGDICVTESIEFVETGCAEEAAAGHSRKASRHVEEAGNGLGGNGPQNCTEFNLTVCAPGTVTFG